MFLTWSTVEAVPNTNPGGKSNMFKSPIDFGPQLAFDLCSTGKITTITTTNKSEVIIFGIWKLICCGEEA
jgi:hypothetical protein